MIKTALIMLLIVTAAAAGNEKARSLKMRAETLRLISRMINETEMLIEYKSATVYEIISSLNKDSRFDALRFIGATEGLCRDNDIAFGEAWEKAVKENMPPYLTLSDAELICSVGRELGTSGIDGQLSALKLKKHEVDILAEEAGLCYSSKGKLYRSLGVLCGAFLAVFLI